MLFVNRSAKRSGICFDIEDVVFVGASEILSAVVHANVLMRPSPLTRRRRRRPPPPPPPPLTTRRIIIIIIKIIIIVIVMIKMTIKICIIDTTFFQAMSKNNNNLKHSCQLALWSKIHTDTTC